MWKAFVAAFVLVATTVAAQAFVFVENAQPATYVGQVGTRAYLDDQASSYTGTAMERGYFYVRSAVTSLQLAFTNFYVDVGDVEQSPGNSFTLKASIEYPPGTCTPVTFASASSGTAADGQALLFADALPIAIPANTKVFWRAYQNVSGNFLSSGSAVDSGALKDVANGDAINVGGSDQTISCTTVTDNGGAMFWPALMLAEISAPSVLLIGDSRARGIRDSYSDGAGCIGDIERSICPYFGELNMGRSAIVAQGFTSHVTARSQMFPYFSTVINELGVNDAITDGATAAALVGYEQSIAGLFGSAPVFQTTLEPHSSSTDGWATTGNQTALDNTVRSAFNADVRSGIAGMAGYFDVTSAVETSQGSGLWKALDTPDGVHANQTGNLAIFNAGVIAASAIHR